RCWGGSRTTIHEAFSDSTSCVTATSILSMERQFSAYGVPVCANEFVESLNHAGVAVPAHRSTFWLRPRRVTKEPAFDRPAAWVVAASEWNVRAVATVRPGCMCSIRAACNVFDAGVHAPRILSEGVEDCGRATQDFVGRGAGASLRFG